MANMHDGSSNKTGSPVLFGGVDQYRGGLPSNEASAAAVSVHAEVELNVSYLFSELQRTWMTRRFPGLGFGGLEKI